MINIEEFDGKHAGGQMGVYKKGLLLFAFAIFTAAAPLTSAQEQSDGGAVPPRSPKIGLIMPVKTEIPITTSHVKGICGKGTLVFYVDNGMDEAFFNLNSQHRGDVKLSIGKDVITPIPGQEIVVTTDTTSEFEDVNPGKVISFRNPKLIHSGAGLRVFKADFSIASAVLGIKPLQAMLHSSDPYQRHLINEVFKNHAIWSDTANADGPYSPGK